MKKYFLISLILFGLLIIYLIINYFNVYIVYSPEQVFLPCFLMPEFTRTGIPPIQDNYPKEDCYNSLAIRKKDTNICKKTESIESCYINYVEKTGDLSVCKIIKDAEYKERCYITYVVYYYKKGICEDIIKIDPNQGDYCYDHAADAENNLNYCGLIKNEKEKSSCYYGFVFEEPFLSSLSICNYITQETSKFECYNKIVENTGNLNICYNETGEFQAKCFTLSAIYNKNENNCDFISQDENIEKAECYYRIAKLKNETAICEKINDPAVSWVKENCIRSFYN